MADKHISSHASDFRLLSRRAVEAIKKLREQHRFIKGLFAWVIYLPKNIDYKMDEHCAGKTK